MKKPVLSPSLLRSPPQPPYIGGASHHITEEEQPGPEEELPDDGAERMHGLLQERAHSHTHHNTSAPLSGRDAVRDARLREGNFFFFHFIIIFSPSLRPPLSAGATKQTRAGTKRIKTWGERRGARAAGAAHAGPRFKSSCAAAAGVHGVRGGAPGEHRRRTAV